MHIVSRPPTNTVTVKAPADATTAPLLRGYGELDFTCGSCGHVLAEGLATASHVAIFVFQCPCCASYNGSPDAAPPAETVLVRRRRGDRVPAQSRPRFRGRPDSPAP
jgi:hypothetical protein